MEKAPGAGTLELPPRQAGGMCLPWAGAGLSEGRLRARAVQADPAHRHILQESGLEDVRDDVVKRKSEPAWARCRNEGLLDPRSPKTAGLGRLGRLGMRQNMRSKGCERHGAPGPVPGVLCHHPDARQDAPRVGPRQGITVDLCHPGRQRAT